ncbi:MAG: ABC transporter permease [Bryobacteraceae bacterium]
MPVAADQPEATSAPKNTGPKWHGEYSFLLWQLILKDFRTRYRNMSLGVCWSLLNPLIMMGVLWFIFTHIMINNSVPHFAAFVLCGLVPYNFFTLAWNTGTGSLLENAALIKRVPVALEIIPISSVLSIGIHLLIQIGLLLTAVLLSGIGVNRYWMWLPFIFACEVVFVCGLALLCSSLNVYVRDMRYVIESATVVLFWLVPIVYPFALVPRRYHEIYQLNPVAALVLAARNILLDRIPPPAPLLGKLAVSSTLIFVAGLAMFRLLRRRFYDYL